jgi:hypothetical protein
MSETAQPRRWQVKAPYIQYRTPNLGEVRVGIRTSAWMVMGGGPQNGIITEDKIHPDDLAHLLQARCPGPFGGPMLEEIAAS